MKTVTCLFGADGDAKGFGLGDSKAPELTCLFVAEGFLGSFDGPFNVNDT